MPRPFQAAAAWREWETMKGWTFGLGGIVVVATAVVAFRGLTAQAENAKAVPAAVAAPPAGAAYTPDPLQIERGRYLVKISGCNDCHTAGYMDKNGEVPEKDWLTGDMLGWSGPWGTTYGKNLRRWVPLFGEDQWVVYARNIKTRPPMPWYVLRQLEEKDLRAIYQYVRHLGPAGDPEPAYVPPGQEPPMPYMKFVAPPPAAEPQK
jgi:mono/diheme cytochrome c family protein